MWTGTARTRRLQAALTAVCATRNGAADRWGRATSRPGGNGRGAGGSASEGAARLRALTGGPGSTVPPGSVLNRFKWIQNSSKFD
jgi:hypothetical protein